MVDILALLQSLSSYLTKITIRQFCRIILTVLAMTGRVTMLGISRWTEANRTDGTAMRLAFDLYESILPCISVMTVPMLVMGHRKSMVTRLTPPTSLTNIDKNPGSKKGYEPTFTRWRC